MTQFVDGVYIITVPMIYDVLIYAALVVLAVVGALRLLARLFPVIGI